MAIIKRNPFDQLIISQSQDSNAVEDSWRQVQASNPSTDVTLSSTFSRLSGSSLRIECNKGEEYNNSHRSEVRSECQLGWERWFAFSIYFPSSFDSDPAEEIVQQIHAGTGGPPMTIRVRDDRLFCELEYGTTSSGTELDYTDIPAFSLFNPVPKNEWIDIVYHFNIDNNTPSNGFWRLWVNRELAFDYQGPLSYTDVPEPPYLKLGIYKWKWTTDPSLSTETQRIIYYDEAAWGDGSDEVEMFEIMDPEGRRALSGIDYGTSVPDAPSLVSPADSSSGISTFPSLNWNQSQGADTYRVQVSDDIGFSSTVYDQSGISGLTTVPSGLLYSTTYYWRVLATNTEGDSSWSNIRSFTTQDAPPPSGNISIKIKINLV